MHGTNTYFYTSFSISLKDLKSCATSTSNQSR